MEGEAGGAQIQGQLEQLSEILCQKMNKQAKIFQNNQSDEVICQGQVTIFFLFPKNEMTHVYFNKNIASKPHHI